MKDFEDQLNLLSTIQKIEVSDIVFEKIQSKITIEKQPDKTVWLYGIAASLLILSSFIFVLKDTIKDNNSQNIFLNMDSSSINFLNY